MKIESDVALAPHTTFKIGGPARFFAAVTNEKELVEAVEFAHKNEVPIFILGGGSNILISDAGFDGLVLKMDMKGVEVRHPAVADGQTLVSVGAGEIWDDLVAQTVGLGLHGLENLSFIPGTVGAAPVQNIGAYGSEVAQTISSVRAFDVDTMKFVDLSNAQCQFSYRDSMFKHHKGKYIITRVEFSLNNNAAVNIEYKDLKEYFEKHEVRRTENGERIPSLSEVRKAVIDIRTKKLPDWKKQATAGSFFKNPIIAAEEFKALAEKYPELPSFPQSDGRVKVPLGWILDKVCDVKGFCVGKVCTYERQALVLVATPGATSADVMGMSDELAKRVKDKTGIEIEWEVEWVR